MAPNVATPKTWATGLGPCVQHAEEELRDLLALRREHVCRTGEDLPQVRDWAWTDRPVPTDLARVTTAQGDLRMTNEVVEYETGPETQMT